MRAGHEYMYISGLGHHPYKDTVQACQQALPQEVYGTVLLHVKEARKAERLDLLTQYLPFLHRNHR